MQPSTDNLGIIMDNKLPPALAFAIIILAILIVVLLIIFITSRNKKNPGDTENTPDLTKAIVPDGVVYVTDSEGGFCYYALALAKVADFNGHICVIDYDGHARHYIPDFIKVIGSDGYVRVIDEGVIRRYILKLELYEDPQESVVAETAS